MDYEKKYKDALERARELKNKLEKNCSLATSTGIESIFPELAESEDERIRKELIEHCYKHQLICNDYEKVKTWIAWLEKQDLKKFEEELEKAYKCADKVQYRKGYEDAKCEIEKQGEQKTADKIEPKFKVGDWIVFNNDHDSIYQVEKIENYEYTQRHILGGSMPLSFSHGDMIRAWTIEDARDGDVLYSPSNNLIWIYKDRGHYYACVNMNYATQNVATNELIYIPDDAIPATKEQRDTLFTKMKEAGYMWDAEKKELNI